jgi:hypothetical protein
MRNVFLGAAAAALLAGSTVAHAAPVATSRTASPVAKSEGFLHGGELWLAILATGLLIFLLFQINDKDNDVLPHSP